MKSVAGYAFEVFIVFLGVYLAFMVTDYQDEVRDRAVRIKYYDSLIYEFRGLIRHLDGEETKLRRHLAVVEDIEKGNRPHIPASDLHYVYPAAVVAAAWEGRNFESLRTQDLRSIISGTPALTSLEELVRMLNQLSATGFAPGPDRLGELLLHRRRPIARRVCLVSTPGRGNPRPQPGTAEGRRRAGPSGPHVEQGGVGRG
ncbi:MAG: hypothetical protein OXH15_00665 [Gammaproteobacteria bacterium]|nr:hypothetical protein [Gammaproteobacteria bacterium]